jgi:PAS domain S-box-containing protein
MSDKEKTKGQLIEELQRLRQRVAELQESENQRKRTEAEIVQLNRELTTLNRVSQVLTSTLDLQETLAIITDHVTWLLGVEAASVILHDEAKGDLWFAAASGEGADFMQSARLTLGQGIAGWVVQQGEPVIVPDVSEDTRWFGDFDKESGLTTGSILCVPLQTKGQTIGAIEVMNKESGTFDQEDLRLLTSMAAPAATAIETARSYDQAQKEIAERRRAEEALQESEENFRALADNANDGIMIAADRGAHVYANRRMAEITGYSVPELLKTTMADLVHPDQLKEVMERFQRRLEGKPAPRQYEIIFVRKDGKSVPLEMTSAKTVWRGQPAAIVVFRDITERKRAELALERRALQLQTAAEVSRAASSILDPDELIQQVVDLVRERFDLYYAGLFLLDEERQFAVLHAGTGEAGRKMLEAGHKLEVGGESMIGWCVVNKQARIALDVGKEAVRFDNPLLPETRSEMALPLVSRGQVIGAMTIQSTQSAAFSKEDITVLQTMADQLANAIANARLYEALTREQYLTRAFMDNVPDHIYFKDRQSRFISISKAMSDWFGLSNPAQAVGKTDFDFFTEDHARPAYEDEQEIIRTGQPLLDMEERETWPDRPDTWVLTSKMPLRDEPGNIVGTFGISRDITGRKAAEAERERLLTALEYRSAQLQTAAEVSRAASSILDPDELIQQVVDLVRERFDLYYAGLFLLDEERQFAVLHAGTGEAGRKMLEAGHKLEVGGESMIGWCVANKQARIALDVGKEAVRFDNPMLPETRSEMALPLVSRGQVIGAMTIQSTQSAAFSKEDITVLQTMADQLASAIENAHLFEDTKSRLAQLTALQETTKAVASTLELDRLIHLITQQATTLLQGDGGIMNLVDWEKKEDEVVAANGSCAHTTGFRGPLEDSLSGWVTLHNQPVISNQLQDDDRVDRYVRSGEMQNQSAAIAPLTIKGQVIGTLVVMDKQGGKGEFNQADLDLLTAFANQAATAIENARLFKETQQTSFLMGLRVKELACLNDIGWEIEEIPSISEFLKWLAGRIPPAMQYPDLCLAAIEFEGQVYGAAEAVSLPCQTVQALRIGGGVVGRIYIAYIEEHDFLDEESALLGEIARRVSGYIESRHLFEQAQTRAEELAVLNEMSRTLTAILDVDAMIESIYHYTSRLMDTTNFYVALYEPQQDAVSFPLYAEGERTRRVGPRRAGKGLTEYVIRTREPLLIEENVSAWLAELGCDLIGQEAQSWLGVPMTIGERVIGVVAVQSYTTPQLYDEHDRDLLSAIASQVAIAIENARLFEQAQARAERERLVRTITDRVRQGTDREAIMRTTLQELGQMLGASKSIVRLGTQEQLLSEH